LRLKSGCLAAESSKDPASPTTVAVLGHVGRSGKQSLLAERLRAVTCGLVDLVVERSKHNVVVTTYESDLPDLYDALQGGIRRGRVAIDVIDKERMDVEANDETDFVSYLIQEAAACDKLTSPHLANDDAVRLRAINTVNAEPGIFAVIVPDIEAFPEVLSLRKPFVAVVPKGLSTAEGGGVIPGSHQRDRERDRRELGTSVRQQVIARASALIEQPPRTPMESGHVFPGNPENQEGAPSASRSMRRSDLERLLTDRKFIFVPDGNQGATEQAEVIAGFSLIVDEHPDCVLVLAMAQEDVRKRSTELAERLGIGHTVVQSASFTMEAQTHLVENARAVYLAAFLPRMMQMAQQAVPIVLRARQGEPSGAEEPETVLFSHAGDIDSVAEALRAAIARRQEIVDRQAGWVLPNLGNAQPTARDATFQPEAQLTAVLDKLLHDSDLGAGQKAELRRG